MYFSHVCVFTAQGSFSLEHTQIFLERNVGALRTLLESLIFLVAFKVFVA